MGHSHVGQLVRQVLVGDDSPGRTWPGPAVPPSVELEHELDLPLPEIGVEPGVLQLGVQRPDVHVGELVGRQLVVLDVRGGDADVLGGRGGQILG